MDHSDVTSAAINRVCQFWPHFFVKPPHHFEKTKRDGPHGAPVGPIGTSKKQGFELPFCGPPEMDAERVVYKNNGIASRQTGFNRAHRTVTINQPAPSGNDFIVPFLKFRIGCAHPVGLPLDIVDGEVRKAVRRANRTAHRGLSATCVPDHHHTCHGGSLTARHQIAKPLWDQH